MNGRWSGRSSDGASSPAPYAGDDRRVGQSGYEARLARATKRPLASQEPDTLIGSTFAGASIWQTPGGVQAELDQINGEFMAFGHELTEVVTSLPGFPSAVDASQRPLVDLFANAWSPLVQEWQKFYADNKGWYDNFWWNHAPEAEKLLRKLVEVRDQARKLGMRVMTPTPIQPEPSLLFDPEKNLFDQGAEGAKHALGDLWSVVKIAALVGLGVGGVVLVSKAIDLTGAHR